MERGSTTASPLRGCKRISRDQFEKLAHVETLAAEGVIGGAQPNAADLQIGATLRVLLTLGDLRPLLTGGVGERIALEYFPEYQGEVPAGAFPAGWTPAT